MSVQLLVNAAISGSVYAMVGLGFAVVISQAKFFHFSHAAIFTAAPYLTLWFSHSLQVPIAIALVLGIVGAGGIGVVIESFLYKPLRHRGASSISLLLASLGSYVVVENIISMIFGDQTESIREASVTEGWPLFGARITGVQVTLVCIGLVSAILIWLLLRATKIGRAMRAIANDPELALVCGIEQDRVLLWTFLVASALAGVAGILVALDVDMVPTMGMPVLMMAVVAAIIGGTSSVPGVVLGSFFVGATQQLATLFLSNQWQNSLAFVLLLGFLLLRPQGILGKQVRKVSV